MAESLEIHSPFSCVRTSLPSCLISSRRFCRPCFMPKRERKHFQTTASTTNQNLTHPGHHLNKTTSPIIHRAGVHEPQVSLTLLGKRRGQDGDLLFLQLPDFTLQFGHSLPNCLHLGRITKRAEDLSVTSSSPYSSVLLTLTFWKNSSSGLLSRAAPECTTSATRTSSSSSEMLSPCQSRSHWHHLLAAVLVPQEPWASGIFLPGHQPPVPDPNPGILTPARPPGPGSPHSLESSPPQFLTCLNSWVLSRMVAGVPWT